MKALLERRFRADPAALKQVREVLRAAVDEAGAGPEEASEVELAVGEACQNVIRHAYGGEDRGDLVLRVARDGAHLVIEIQDFADPVDPECVHRERNLDEVRPGGLGTHFMRSVMDEVQFVECSEMGNRLRMRKRLVEGAPERP